MAMSAAEFRQRVSTFMPGSEGEQLAKAYESLVNDLATFKTSFNTLVAKLNLDAGVTDVNYAPIP